MAFDISAPHARRHRLRNQLLAGSDLAPADVMERAVALQGQDLSAVVRAIALRSRPDTTVADVVRAFDEGRLVRSWPMRGTLFATTPGHLATLLYFTAERIHRMTAGRREQLGLDTHLIAHARDVLHEALTERPRTRAEALALWEAAGIDTTAGRGYHLFMHLAVDGFVHWGRFTATRDEQMLELSTTPPPDDPESALTGIVRSYIEARGPATLADLAWWTKLPKTMLRRAAASIDDLVEVTVNGTPAWVIGAPPGGDGGEAPDHVCLVPGFDEWILGYTDRSLVASPAALKALVPGGNGVFRPAILVDGIVVGTWKASRRSGSRDTTVTHLVESLSTDTKKAVDDAIAAWPYR
ncbi:winged helix DNA-binding domain-containing protein [Nocardia paucivorans]|uniref:winged helix DNA-binding domain-containing protein n=1 Tax=Nocardia paucivorans TaxID=114259 RepID=UPI00031B796E|nr:winged helix DNA-binding domain-containing protein [Nocardia paucivorans]